MFSVPLPPEIGKIKGSRVLAYRRQQQFQTLADQPIDHEKEQRRQNRHREYHRGGGHKLAAGWPNDLGNLGAGLLNKLDRVGHGLLPFSIVG